MTLLIHGTGRNLAAIVKAIVELPSSELFSLLQYVV